MIRKKLAVATTLTLLFLVGMFFVLEYTDTTHFLHNKNIESSQSDNVTKATPATKNDQAISDEIKDTNLTNTQNSGEDNDKKQAVSVVITNTYLDKSSLSVNGYVEGVVENGGKCTLTLIDQSGERVSSSRNAEPNVSTTTCGQSIIERSKLHSGTWQATLSYASNDAAGASEPKKIEVN